MDTLVVTFVMAVFFSRLLHAQSMVGKYEKVCLSLFGGIKGRPYIGAVI